MGRLPSPEALDFTTKKTAPALLNLWRQMNFNSLHHPDLLLD
jgi:hypothetical protein